MAAIEKRDTAEGIAYRAKVRVKGHPAQSARRYANEDQAQEVKCRPSGRL